MACKFGPDCIEVSTINIYYDTATATKTRETPTLLQYESQHFRCKVQLELNQSMVECNWTVGLIQACDRMYLENRYGNAGSSFWEFHPLKSGRHRMVNDSDGRQYPFYSLTSSKCEIRRGLIQDSYVNLQYEDHFYPTVAWELPYCGGARLTDVIRKQDFWVWLVAIKRAPNREGAFDTFAVGQDKIYVLKTMRWRYNLHMTFDPHQPYGRRLKRIYDTQNELPYVCDTNTPMPLSAANPPHCNAAQSLIWYPNDFKEKAKLLVPPKQIIVPWEQWLADMAPDRHLVASRPRDCVVVDEWRKDDNVAQPELKSRMKESRLLVPGYENIVRSRTRSRG